MKKIFTLLTVVALTQISSGQHDTLLCDFDGQKKVYFKDFDGTLDSMAANPQMTGNTSPFCGKYIRKNTQFDNLKLYTLTKFVDISSFAQATTNAKITMKVMSKMPAGTKIDIQLGSRTDQSYPGGIHSTYTGTTTVVNQWETITFHLTQNLSASGGFPYPGSIDKFVILFNSNALTKDTVYFDDVRGPKVEAPVSVKERETVTFKVSQNTPNPAKDNTAIHVDLLSSGHLSVSVYDLVGKNIATLFNGDLNSGSHAFTFNTENLPNGVYFYTVKKGEFSQTMKMVVSK